MLRFLFIFFKIIIFGMLGILFVVFGTYSLLVYNKKMATYTPIQGTVVDYKLNYDHSDDDDDIDNEPTKSIIVEYTVDGKKYKLSSNSYSDNPKSIGTNVAVKYDPGNPEDSIFEEDISIIVALIIVGLLIIIISVGIQWLGWKGSQRMKKIIERNREHIDNGEH